MVKLCSLEQTPVELPAHTEQRQILGADKIDKPGPLIVSQRALSVQPDLSTPKVEILPLDVSPQIHPTLGLMIVEPEVELRQPTKIKLFVNVNYEEFYFVHIISIDAS